MSRLSEYQRYLTDTVVFLNKQAVLIPFVLIASMTFYAVGLLPDHRFNMGIYIFISVCLLGVAVTRSLFLQPTQLRQALFLVTYHILGILILLFVTGFNTPFAVFWLILFIDSYANYGLKGYILSAAALLATAAADVALWAGSSSYDVIAVTFYTIFISILGFVVAQILEKARLSQFNLEKSRLEEITQQGRLNTLLNSMAEGVVAVTPEGVVRLQNATILSLLDTNESLIGRHIDEAFKLTNEDGKRVKAQALIKNVKTVVMRTDLTHHLRDNDALQLSIQVTPIRTSFRGEGEPGFVIILRDITKEKTLEQERDEFISVVSHELRTPVTIAEGSLSNLMYMQQKGLELAIVGKAAKTAHEQVLYLAKMVNDLSTLSRAERGLGDQQEEIDLNELFKGLYQKYLPEAERKGLHLNLNIPARLPRVIQSRLYLEEILQNFITNALKYTQEGSVTMHAHKTAGGVECAVSDTGIGISRSDQTKIFQKFYRSEDYRTRETSGTGLGLYVVKKLASKMDIEVTFKSRLNHGSRFGFVLPVKH